MRWEYELHEAERRARIVRQNRVLFLVAILCLVVLAAMPAPDHDRNARHDTDGCGSADAADPPSVGRVTWPPLRGDDKGWRDWIADGGPEPSLRRVTDGPPVGLADALHLGGNGLVPAVAAAAFLQLAQRARVLT